MLPYKDIEVTDTYIIREFDENIDPIELKWHRDREDRLIEIVGETNWMLQLENNLPTSSYKNYKFIKDVINDYNDDKLKLPAVWKSAKFGYDGKGVKILKNINVLNAIYLAVICLSDRLIHYHQVLFLELLKVLF